MRSLAFPLLLGLHCTVNAKPFVFDTSKSISYVGYTRNGSDSFLNIPYGQDTGLNRFGPPQAFVPSAGTVLNNTVSGKACPQTTGGHFTYKTILQLSDLSENCLNLKVVRPNVLEDGAKLPVMVYIYGGSLFTGQAYERTQTGEGLVRQSVENGLPVIYVAMNYRLNIFGFALSESLRGEKSLNVGLRDQRLALDWVQENIALFGGDPRKVTIFGQSSGGLSVGLQILAFGGTKKAPFHQAIIESTALEPTMTSNLTLITFNAVAEWTGCANGSNPQSKSTLDCLKGLSMESLLNTTLAQQDSTSSQNDGDTYLPTVDGDFLPAAPSALLAAGNFSRIPFIAGWTNDDATPFTDASIQTANDTSAFISNIYKSVTTDTLSTLLSLYPVSDFTAKPTANLSAEFYRSAQIFRDVLLACPNFLLGAAMAKKIKTNVTSDLTSFSASLPIFLYVQNQTIRDTTTGLGVQHTSELPYVFGDFEPYNTSAYTVHPTASDYELARAQSRSWSTFASVGRPSVNEKNTLKGWQGSYAGWKGDVEGVVGTKLYVVGGPTEGLSMLDGPTSTEVVRAEKLAERCGFLNRPEVVLQLQY